MKIFKSFSTGYLLTDQCTTDQSEILVEMHKSEKQATMVRRPTDSIGSARIWQRDVGQIYMLLLPLSRYEKLLEIVDEDKQV